MSKKKISNVDEVVTPAPETDSVTLPLFDDPIALPEAPAPDAADMPEVEVPETKQAPVRATGRKSRRAEVDSTEVVVQTVENARVGGEIRRRRVPTIKQRDALRATIARKSQESRGQMRTANPGDVSNPTLLVFPTDKFGLTSALKTAMTALASRLMGDVRKKEVFDATLDVLVAHVNAKFEADKARRDAGN